MRCVRVWHFEESIFCEKKIKLIKASRIKNTLNVKRILKRHKTSRMFWKQLFLLEVFCRLNFPQTLAQIKFL
jgi:hypothetical protein